MQKTTSLEASKAIQGLGVEMVTEKWWVNDGTKENPKWVCVHKDWTNIVSSVPPKLPAPNLQELFDILPAIGEKLGWKDYTDEPITTEATQQSERDEIAKEWNVQTYTSYITHIITDLYLTGGMTAVDEYIIKLINEK